MSGTFDSHKGFAIRNGYRPTDCTGSLCDTGERIGERAVLECNVCSFDVSIPASWIDDSDGSNTTVGQSGDCPF